HVQMVEGLGVGQVGPYAYVSKPDFMVEDIDGLWTVDLKFTQAYQIKPLTPDNDQMLGQAIINKAVGFYRVTFQVMPRTYELNGPIIERHLVDPALAEEWLEDTKITISNIISARLASYFEKHTDSCWAYNRLCEFKSDCVAGFNLTKGGSENGEAVQDQGVR